MTIHEFSLLSDSDKVRIVLAKAIPLMDTTYYGNNAKLYAIENFFIEIQFDSVTGEVIRLVLAKGEILNKYLARIILSLE